MKTFNNNFAGVKDAKELLITIDMVNGFVKEGTLAAPNIMDVVPRQVELLQEAVNDDKTGLIFIRDCHRKDSVELKRYAPHCIEGTSETEVIDELKNYVIYGLTFFKNSTNLTYTLQKSLLEFKNLERINLMGCLSEVCVLDGALGLRTYLDEMNKDVEVCVYPDAIDTYDAPGHDRKEINEKAIAFMEANGIKILRKER